MREKEHLGIPWCNRQGNSNCRWNGLYFLLGFLVVFLSISTLKGQVINVENDLDERSEMPMDSYDWIAYQEQIHAERTQKNEEFKTKGSPPFKTEKARKSFTGLDWYNPDPAFRVLAKVERFANSDTLEFPTSAGTIKSFIRYAQLIVTVDGITDTLEAFRSIQNIDHPVYSKLLFVPFTDLNTGVTCYGGGRYLDPPLSEESTLILDFNEAYNPYCAYSDGWFCPIPPRQNDLRFAVNAGEKQYPGADDAAGTGGKKKGH